MQRYFQATAAKYEAMRRALDDALGFPSESGSTAITPAATAPKDASGKVLVAIAELLHQLPKVAAVLAAEVSGGNVTEITADDYRASVAYDMP